jgi:DNA-directed RNA polymerase specialized sigma subunit
MEKQLQNILKEMISIRKKIYRSVSRSQVAYELYITEKKYYQALRIWQANKEIYKLLLDFLYYCNEEELGTVQNYIFHLEDWFNQFEELEKVVVSLESEFFFKRFKGSPEFPKRIIDITKK